MLAMRSEIDFEGFSQAVSGAMTFGNFTRNSVNVEDERQSNSVMRIALPLRRFDFLLHSKYRGGCADELTR
jgi:hypothetical protein